MFVKILWTKGNISLYECDSVLLIDEKKNGNLKFLMQPGDKRVSVDDSNNGGIFYLNNQGDTIDFIRGPLRK